MSKGTEQSECKDWYAWLNTELPKPDEFHVTGEVLCGDPGYKIMLTKRKPPGINPTELILDMLVKRLPGEWQQIETCVSTRYDEVIVPHSDGYNSVKIYEDEHLVADLEVDIIS